jgi:hypothetical protein
MDQEMRGEMVFKDVDLGTPVLHKGMDVGPY